MALDPVDVTANREAQLFERPDIPVYGLAADMEPARKLLHVRALPLLQGLQQAQRPNNLAIASHRSVLVISVVAECVQR